MSLLQQFNNLDPVMKRRAAIVGGVLGVILVAYVMVSFGSGGKSSFRREKPTINSVLTDKDPRKVGLDSLNTTQIDQGKKLDEMSRNIKILSEATNTQKEAIGTFKELTRQMDEMKQQMDESKAREEEFQRKAKDLEEKLKKGVAAAPAPGTDQVGPPGQKSAADIAREKRTQDRYKQALSNPNENQQAFFNSAPQPVEEVKKPGSASKKDNDLKIRTIAAEEPKEDKDKKDKESDVFLPAGSIISGALITGLDAPTGNNARRDPFPVLLRIKKEAVLPNRFRADVRECFLIASAFGDLSSERAYARAETISCVREDGGVIESGLDAYAAGEDGKAGIRGRLVSKQGAILARSLMAGFMQGVSQAFSVSQVPTINVRGVGDKVGSGSDTYSPVYQQALNGEALQGAAVSGAGKALERIADFYLEMAENLYPVIEVDAAREIDFIVKKGVPLKIK